MFCRHFPSIVLVFCCAFVFARNGRSQEPAFPLPEKSVSTPSPSDAVELIRLEPLDPAAIYPPVVNAMAASNDGRLLVAAGDDHALRVVEIESGRILKTLEGHIDWVQAVVFDEKSNDIYSCAKDGTLRVWYHDQGWASKVIHQCTDALMALAIDGEHRRTAVTTFGHAIEIISLEDNSVVSQLSSPCDDLPALAFSSDGKQLAAAGRDGVVRVWNWQSNPTPLEQSLHRDRIRAVHFSLDGTEITTIGEDRRVVCYKPQLGQVVADRTLKGGRLLSMVFVDDSTLAVAGSDNTIRLINTTTGDELNQLIGHEGSVAVMAMAGPKLVSGSFDTTIRLWDLNRVKEVGKTSTGRYVHPISSRFPDSGIGEIGETK
jgi:WD40 repeat protein